MEKILIVDDCKDIHAAVRAWLNGANMQAFSAFHSGDQAFHMAADIKPDLILLDIDMPDMNGFELCQLLKRDIATTEIPIIFLTATNHIEDIKAGMACGAIDYISKPIKPQLLVARIRKALGQASAGV